ncbi:MAG: 50S ribosomal protein L25 [Acidobacteria bacterium]|nr:50S ribosomal protein L25 [Acidobacteriota bacterium]
MSEAFTIEAEPREEFGKNEARRTRQQGRIPGVVYGGGGPSIPVTVDPRKVADILRSEAGHNAIFTLEIRGKAPARVMLRDWQVEPLAGRLLHVDMVRVALDIKLRVKVPIHITGEAKGVKVQGGIFEFLLREVEIECLPDNIPDHIVVDVTELMIGKTLRVSDLPASDKFKVLTDANRAVAHVVTLKVEEEKPVEVVAEAAPTEPEVIKKGKAEAEEGEEEEEGPGKKEKKEKKES